MTGRVDTMDGHAPGFLTALLAFLSGGGLFTLIIALLKRPLERAEQRLKEQAQAEKQKLEEQIQADKVRQQLQEQADKLRSEMRLGDRDETKQLLDSLSARLKATEERGDLFRAETQAQGERQDVKIAGLQVQIDELRSEKFRLEGQLHALELLKATETQRANMAEAQMTLLGERICLLEEQLRLANEELAERLAARRFGDRAGD